MDVTNEEQVKTMVERIVSEFTELNIVINNAGICQKITVEEQSLEDWKKTMDVNVNGVFLVSKYTGKQMKAQGAARLLMLRPCLASLLTRKRNVRITHRKRR